jgi:HSP20 family molecular chaperone IbpA
MSRIINSPLLLGFEEIERMLDRIGKTAGDAYPPYNIERIPASDSESERIRIVMAVAGFSSDQLEVTVDGNELTIRGEQNAEENRDYLHRGIAARRFKRSFVLTNGLEVRSAELDNGLLGVELACPEPSRLVKRIEIKDRL